MRPDDENLLRRILAAYKHVESLPKYRDPNDDPDEWGRRHGAKLDLPEIGVRISGEWIGSSDADRKHRQRVLSRLESAGFVTLHASWGRNKTHVKLTAAGRSAAEQLEDSSSSLEGKTCQG